MTTQMRTLEGLSAHRDAEAAVAEATGGWDDIPQMIFAFCSTEQDADGVARALSDRFPGVPMAGCSTAGEHLRGQHHRASLVVAGLCDSGVDWACTAIEGLDGLDDAAARTVVANLFEQHQVDPDAIDPRDFVALLFVDGMSGAEERVAAALANALEEIPLAGGSAGDDLAFERTAVICNGSAASDRATVVLARSRGTTLRVIKHQHFTTEPDTPMLAVTRADEPARIVHELDGYPAARAYAAALGLRRDQLTDAFSFLHPVVFRCNGEIYVRSIQSINDDDSITFYCAIEEGMVLQLGSHSDVACALQQSFEDAGPVDFLLGFNCVLRALEITQKDEWSELGATISALSRSSIGFDTYGEQFDGLHINQTLVAVTFRSQEHGR